MMKAAENNLANRFRLKGGALRAYLVGEVERLSDYDLEFFGTEAQLLIALPTLQRCPFEIEGSYGKDYLYRGKFEHNSKIIDIDVILKPELNLHKQLCTPVSSDFSFNLPFTYYDPETASYILLGPDGSTSPEEINNAIENPFNRVSKNSFREDPVLLLRALHFNAQGFTPSEVCLGEMLETLSNDDFKPYQTNGHFQAYFRQNKDSFIHAPLLDSQMPLKKLLCDTYHFLKIPIPARLAAKGTGATLFADATDEINATSWGDFCTKPQ